MLSYVLNINAMAQALQLDAAKALVKINVLVNLLQSRVQKISTEWELLCDLKYFTH